MTKNVLHRQVSLLPESFQVIFHESPISTQIFSSNGDTVMVNRAWEKLWQAKSEAIVAKYNILKDKQLKKNKILPLVQAAFKGSKQELPVIKYEPNKTIPNISKTPYLWVKAIIYPIKNKRGKVSHVVLQYEDITASYEYQRRLQESESKFRTFFDGNIIGVFVSELGGKILEANDVFLQMTGYTRKDLQSGIIHRDTLTATDYSFMTQQSMERLYKVGSSLPYEKVYIRKDGLEFPVLLAVARVDDTQTCIGFALDITERRKSEEANFRLAAIVASSDDAIVSKTLDGIITSWNEGAERLFGYSAAEAVGQSILLILPPQLYDEEEEILAKLKNGERIQHYQTERLKKDGTLIPVSLTISPIKDDSGRIIGVSKIARDITEQKRVEQQKNDFLSMASHELKTPLTSMKMFLELLGRELDVTEHEQAKYFVNRIHDQTNQLVELTNDLLDVSRIETGKLRLHIESFRLDDLIRETVEAIATSSRIHKLLITQVTPLTIQADRYRVFQVLINLITNAIKYSPHGREIHIALTQKDGDAIVSVQDFGIGIKKDQQDKVFERLYQVTDAKEKTYPGLGLGLYISKEIVHRHKGRIWLKSKKGKGSTFYFSLPIHVLRSSVGVLQSVD